MMSMVKLRQHSANVFPVQCWWISIIGFGGFTVDFVAGVGFRFFACGFRLLGGGFCGFR